MKIENQASWNGNWSCSASKTRIFRKPVFVTIFRNFSKILKFCVHSPSISRKNTSLKCKKNWQWAPLKQIFFVQNRLKVGWAPYRSHEITCIFWNTKSLSKKTRLRKTLLFCGENFYLGGMYVFSKAHFWGFWNPSGPESRPIHSFSIILVSNWHIFWIYWILLQVHNINIFIQRPNSHVLKINSTGGSM